MRFPNMILVVEPLMTPACCFRASAEELRTNWVGITSVHLVVTEKVFLAGSVILPPRLIALRYS